MTLSLWQHRSADHTVRATALENMVVTKESKHAIKKDPLINEDRPIYNEVKN